MNKDNDEEFYSVENYILEVLDSIQRGTTGDVNRFRWIVTV